MITPHGSASIFQSLESWCNLVDLNLRGTHLVDAGAAALAAALFHHPRLQVLNLCDCNIGGVDITSLAAAFQLLTSLKQLSLSYNPLHDDGVTAVFANFTSSSSLEELHIECVSMSSSGVLSFCSLLPHFPRLKLLNLVENAIGHAACSFANTLRDHSFPFLTEIHLSRTGIDGSVLCAFAAALPRLPNLKSLHLDWNQIDAQSVLHFVAEIEGLSLPPQLRLIRLGPILVLRN
jgi:Ran GTPase-activating protein (RanGAP) involved in mRNA processing and transport